MLVNHRACRRQPPTPGMTCDVLDSTTGPTTAAAASARLREIGVRGGLLDPHRCGATSSSMVAQRLFRLLPASWTRWSPMHRMGEGRLVGLASRACKLLPKAEPVTRPPLRQRGRRGSGAGAGDPAREQAAATALRAWRPADAADDGASRSARLTGEPSTPAASAARLVVLRPTSRGRRVLRRLRRPVAASWRRPRRQTGCTTVRVEPGRRDDGVDGRLRRRSRVCGYDG